jgi:hypothetical protein
MRTTEMTDQPTTAWTADKPFKVGQSIANADRLTRSTETISLFATEAEARAAFAAPRARREVSRMLSVLHFGKPDGYGHRDSLECLAKKKFKVS